jgi:hypothetical protein
MASPVFAYVHLLSYPVPAIVGIAKYSGLQKALKVLSALSLLSCLNIGTQFVLASLKVKNYFVSDYFRVIEVGMLCAIFQMSIGQKPARLILKSLGGLFVGVWIVDMILPTSDHFNNVMAMISRVFVLVMSLITLQAAMKDETSPLFERSIFWVGVGAAIYSSGTLLLLGLSNYLLQLGTSYFLAAWHINWALLIAANLFYTKGMLCKSQG